MTQRIRLAIQKSGRLTEACKKLFENSGLTFNVGDRQLLYNIPEMPIDLLFVRDDDIPILVSKGICDFGIVGLNVFEEKKLEENGDFDAQIFATLGLSQCRLSLAMPVDKKFTSLGDLNGLKIATTYPRIVKNFLTKNNIQAEIVHMLGSVEIAPSLQLSDAIVDIVSSGATLKQNNMKEVMTLLASEAVLIYNKNISNIKKNIAERFMKRVYSALSVYRKKYVVLNAPRDKIEEITKLLPGSESPTVVPLVNPNMVSLHAICSEERFWEVMERLKSAGASSIAVLSIEKMLD